jgi:endonuclease/exonuclease/phosphatase family metal-dependent hydrolase
MRILLYNIMLCAPIYMHNGQIQRTHQIVRKILSEAEPYDVLVFLEVFYNAGKKILIEELRHIYPYWKELPRSRFSFVSGGVVTMSRYPIARTYHKFFKAASGAEKMASKGFLWTQIHHPNEGMINVISSHFQAWTMYDSTRHKQFSELRDWQSLGIIPPNQPIIIVGDLNWCFHNQRTDFYKSVGQDVQLPVLLGDMQFTADNKRNSMRGLDSTADELGCAKSYYCQICFSSSDHPGLCSAVCNRPIVKEPVRCVCCDVKCLDYGYIPNGNQQANTFQMRILEWKADQTLHFPVWRAGWISRPVLATRDMSDHFPVQIIVTW